MSKWFFRANPHLFNCFRINRTSEFGATMVVQTFHHSKQKFTKVLHSFCPLAQQSACTALAREFGSPLFSQNPLFYTIPFNFLAHQKFCSVELNYFEGQKAYNCEIPTPKVPNTLRKCISVNSLFSIWYKTRHTASKFLRFENRRQKVILWMPMKSRVTEHTSIPSMFLVLFQSSIGSQGIYHHLIALL